MDAMLIDPARLFPAETCARKVARECSYEQVQDLPPASRHGHSQRPLVRQKQTFPDPATLSVQPDHSVNRMLNSEGVSMDDLEIGQPAVENPWKVWGTLASHSYLFRGTPTRMWLDNAFNEPFGSRNGCRTKTPIIILTPSPKSCVRRCCCPARSTSGSGLKC
jgi:glucuronate isomerase